MTKNQLVTTLILLLALLLTVVACSPASEAPTVEPTEPALVATNTPAPDEPVSSDTPPSPATPEPGPTGEGIGGGEAFIDTVEVLIMESFPVQVAVEISGNLSDGCTTIENIQVEQEGNTFDVNVVTQRDPDAICTQALVPFTERLTLDVQRLEAGTYTVNVNGVTETFELPVANVPVEEPAVLEMPNTCFPETEQDAPFINVGDSYCVQYPVQAGFRVKDVFPGIAAIWGQPLTPGFEPVRSGLTIVKQGTAAGLALDDVVAEVLAQNPDAQVVDANATFAGEPAQVVEGIPGMMESRRYYTIHNDFVYEITLVPINEQGELAEEVGAQRDLLWQTAVNTFTWLPPAVTEQFSECPVGTQEASPYVNVANAYCLLYPSYFRQQYFYSQGEVLFLSGAADPTIPDPVMALLHVAAPEAANGRSLAQVVDDVVAEYEDLEITRTESMLAGEPALVVEGLPGRNEARHLYAIHNDTVYHLWVEPLDIADVAGDAEAAWQMVLDSFTFLR